MQLTYTSHLHTHVHGLLDSGETLGDYVGPGTVFFPISGDDPACREVWAKGIEIDDPLDSTDEEAPAPAKLKEPDPNAPVPSIYPTPPFTIKVKEEGKNGRSGKNGKKPAPAKAEPPKTMASSAHAPVKHSGR